MFGAQLPEHTYSESFRGLYRSALKKLENRTGFRRSGTTTAGSRWEVTSKLVEPKRVETAVMGQEHRVVELPEIFQVRRRRKF
jgi:hypothetical protein